jgi:superfamily I DNA and/or RNA helicase
MGRLFRDSNITELISELLVDDSEEKLQAIGDLAAQSSSRLFLFESLIVEELARQERDSTNPIAKKLTFQHRMHPAIARIISQAFYQKELSTDPERKRFFDNEEAPVISADASRLPDSPMVWVDMPWIQSTKGMKDGEQKPAYHNPQEREAVLAILRLLRVRKPTEKAPSLALLTPYSQQVKRLTADLSSQPSLLKHLTQFRAASHQAKWVGTVDSFQGNEADVVILSLVRNNRSGMVYPALGFLADARRMNVMLSRARWRLIVVGSLNFLRETVRADQARSRGDTIAFLPELIKALDQAEQDGNLKILPASAVLP